MPIFGIGIDLVEVQRVKAGIEKFPERMKSLFVNPPQADNISIFLMLPVLPQKKRFPKHWELD
jgi:hypothetical protein